MRIASSSVFFGKVQGLPLPLLGSTACFFAFAPFWGRFFAALFALLDFEPVSASSVMIAPASRKDCSAPQFPAHSPHEQHGVRPSGPKTATIRFAGSRTYA